MNLLHLNIICTMKHHHMYQVLLVYFTTIPFFSKKGGTGTQIDPYVLYSVSESFAVDWYDKQIISASFYDRNNKNRLINNIPNHIKDDIRNEPFLTFINMTGEHFDKIWTYIDQVTQIYDRKDGIDTGLSRDLIWHVGRSFGFYLNDGQDLVSLPEYTLEADVTEFRWFIFDTIRVSTKDISREIWKRILNNIFFFLKISWYNKRYKRIDKLLWYSK